MRFTASTLLALLFVAVSTSAFDQPLYTRRHLDLSERDIQESTLDARTISALLEDVLAARDADADAQHSPAAQYGPSKAELEQTPRSWAAPSSQSPKGKTGNKRRSAASPSTPTKAQLDQTPRSWAAPSSQSPKGKTGNKRRSIASPVMYPLEARFAPTTYHPHLARRLAALPSEVSGPAVQRRQGSGSGSGGKSGGGGKSTSGGGATKGGPGSGGSPSKPPKSNASSQVSPIMNRIDAECGNSSPTTCA